MGLIARLAVRRVHVLVVPVPGAPLLRMRTEAGIRARGWVLATTPADADALLVCGRAGDELGEVVDRIWDQLPVPRARAVVVSADEVAPALDGLRARLLDDAGQRAEGRDAMRVAAASDAQQHEHDEMHEHEAASDHGHEMPTAPGHDPHAMHGEGMHAMHGHGMSMAGPGGIPLAEGSSDDRDGLEMDVLHLPLGPVLPDWPAGLLVELTLSGDVVLEAAARLLGAAPGQPGEDDPLPRDAAALVDAADRAARLLRLAGWAAPARRLDAVRDHVLAGQPPLGQVAALRRCRARVRRSVALQWGLGGVRATASGVDVRTRLLAALHDAVAAANGRPADASALDPEALPALLIGRGLADVRLLVAGAGSDPVPHAVAAHHG